jgi:hypothetical protein
MGRLIMGAGVMFLLTRRRTKPRFSRTEYARGGSFAERCHSREDEKPPCDPYSMNRFRASCGIRAGEVVLSHLKRASYADMLETSVNCMPRNLIIRFGLAACLVLFAAGCSTVESRIQSNPEVYGSLSPADQNLVRNGGIRSGLPKSAVFLAWGRPDHIRQGYRGTHPFEAWIYTTTQSEVVPGYYPGFYDFGYYRYHGYWPSRRWGIGGGFYGPMFNPYPDDIISYEVPYKTAYFENGRCTAWEYSR